MRRALDKEREKIKKNWMLELDVSTGVYYIGG
jgi:hypothetical protein